MEDRQESKLTKSGRGGFRPGSGRKPGTKTQKTLELEAAARQYTDDAFKALVYVAMRGKNESARITAATAILDRGWGKPRQAVELTGKNGGAIAVEDARATLAVRIAGLAARMGTPNLDSGADTNGTRSA